GRGVPRIRSPPTGSTRSTGRAGNPADRDGRTCRPTATTGAADQRETSSGLHLAGHWSDRGGIDRFAGEGPWRPKAHGLRVLCTLLAEESMSELMAKSPTGDGRRLRLVDHTKQVIDAGEQMFGKPGFPTDLGRAWLRFFRLDPAVFDLFARTLRA